MVAGRPGVQPTGAPATGNNAPLPLWPEVKRGKLSNGLTYYVMKHKQPLPAPHSSAEFWQKIFSTV